MSFLPTNNTIPVLHLEVLYDNFNNSYTFLYEFYELQINYMKLFICYTLNLHNCFSVTCQFKHFFPSM